MIEDDDFCHVYRDSLSPLQYPKGFRCLLEQIKDSVTSGCFKRIFLGDLIDRTLSKRGCMLEILVNSIQI